MRAGIYLRVSTSEQAKEGTSLATQEDHCSAYAKAKGWEIVDVFADVGVSGAKESRPELDRLMSCAKARRIDVIVIAKLDRLGRSVAHLAKAFTELDQLGVDLVSVAESFDSSTSTGRLMRHQLGAFAEFERDRITERTVAGLRRIAEAGFWPGGPAPFGYQRAEDPAGSKHTIVVIDEQQRDLLRLVYSLIVEQGYTTYSAAAYLNANGYRTVRGSLWRHNNLCFRLRQKHLTGTWTYEQGADPIEIEIPAIFSQSEWDRLQASIKGRPRGQRSNRLYPLTGKGRNHLRCDCDGNYFGLTDSSKKNRSYYKCSRNHHAFGEERCAHRPGIIRAVNLEAAVWDEVEAVLTNETYLLNLASEYLGATGDDPADDDRGAIERRLATLHGQKIRMARKHAEDDRLDFLTDAITEITAEERALQKQLQAIGARYALQHDAATVKGQLRQLADTARHRMANPSLELMAEVFDLLGIDLVRVSSDRFEGTGSIPLPEDGGEVWEEGPQRH